jgi:hypothetical protein
VPRGRVGGVDRVTSPYEPARAENELFCQSRPGMSSSSTPPSQIDVSRALLFVEHLISHLGKISAASPHHVCCLASISYIGRLTKGE